MKIYEVKQDGFDLKCNLKLSVVEKINKTIDNLMHTFYMSDGIGDNAKHF